VRKGEHAEPFCSRLASDKAERNGKGRCSVMSWVMAAGPARVWEGLGRAIGHVSFSLSR